MLWKTLICQENPLNFCFTLKGMGAGLLVKRLNQFCMNTHCIAHKKKLSNKIYAFIQSLNNIIWFRSIMHSKKIPIFYQFHSIFLDYSIHFHISMFLSHVEHYTTPQGQTRIQDEEQLVRAFTALYTEGRFGLEHQLSDMRFLARTLWI